MDEWIGPKNDEKLLNISKIPARKTAVSIKGHGPDSAVPQITAAGRGTLAEQILQLAFDNGVPVREDGPLANILATLELDSPIPSEAIMAVAEILFYVYQANQAPDPFRAAAKDANTS